MKDRKKANRIYLRKVFRVKVLFYPFILILIKLRLASPFEKLINRLVRLAGIKKNIHYFFKYTDYARIFKSEFPRVHNETGEVLFPLMTGVHSNFTLLNLLISKFLKDEHNLKPVFYICDSAFGICTKDGMLKLRKDYPWFCHECWHGYKHIEQNTGIETLRMKSRLTGDSILPGEELTIRSLKTLSDCVNYSFDRIDIGIIARKSVLRYFLTGNLSDSEEVREVYKRFLLATLQYYVAFKALLEERNSVRYVIMNNGSLAFEAVARIACERRSIPYMTYETYIGDNSLIYKRNGPVMDLDWEAEYGRFIKTHIMGPAEEEKVAGFFKDLRKGVGMYAVLNTSHEASKMKDTGRFACLFTNLNYDTAVIDKNFLFRDMEEWIISVIEMWKKREDDISLVIRIHPGEIKLVTASNEYMGERIIKACDNHPKIVVFDSVEKINSYELINEMEFGMIYSSTIGLEIASTGKNCLVAGLPWFRNKPFVLYPGSREEYFNCLDRLCRHSHDFKPDLQELKRTIFFVYFNRIKRFNGIKLYTPTEESNTIFNDSDAMIEMNRPIFEEFRDELFGKHI